MSVRDFCEYVQFLRLFAGARRPDMLPGCAERAAKMKNKKMSEKNEIKKGNLSFVGNIVYESSRKMAN